jgi:hypothetical protein
MGTTKIILVTILVIVALMSFGCSNNSNNGKPEPSFFPVQVEKPEFDMQALLQGVLTRDNDGYLRVYDELIIWPYGYSYQIEGEDIWILDDNSIRIFKVGDFVHIGGGEIPKDWAEEKIGQSLPENCQGPYWLMAQYHEWN